jgi:hypothetical protein
VIRVGPAAQSVLDVDVIDGHDSEVDKPAMATLRAHLEPDGIRRPATPADSVAIASALTELANAYDDVAEGLAPGDRAFARRARDQLTVAASRVRAVG